MLIPPPKVEVPEEVTVSVPREAPVAESPWRLVEVPVFATVRLFALTPFKVVEEVTPKFATWRLPVKVEVPAEGTVRAPLVLMVRMVEEAFKRSDEVPSWKDPSARAVKSQCLPLSGAFGLVMAS